MFESQELTDAFKNFKKDAEGFSSRADTVSSDINKLEDELKASNITIPVEVEVTSDSPLSRAETDELDEHGYTSGAMASEWVCWGKDQKTGKYRIQHKRFFEPESRPDFTSIGLECEIEVKPLIEAPLQKRMLAYKKLPELIQKLQAEIIH